MPLEVKTTYHKEALKKAVKQVVEIHYYSPFLKSKSHYYRTYFFQNEKGKVIKI